MKDLTVIIPVDRIDDDRKKLFERAFSSIDQDASDVIVVGPKDEIEKLSEVINDQRVRLLENDNINLPHQVNLAVSEVKTKYFSVLEYDDYYTAHWFKNLEIRMNSKPGLFAYLPICEVFDYKNEGKIVGYMNEPVWASSFSEVLGFFDNESLMNYINVNCTGGVFDKDDFVEIGGLKESMKLTFWYEMLLRANYKAKKIYVVPKIGYKHCINRPESLMDVYSKTIPNQEAEWWFNLAREEQYFKKDRNKQYKK